MSRLWVHVVFRDNMSIKPTREYLALSADVAEQIKDLPDGTKIEFKFD